MLERFEEDIERAVREFPQFAEQIKDLKQLTLDEIDRGGSLEHEIYSCYDNIDQLLNGE